MENDKIKLVGEVTTFQTDLDNNEIPGTREVHKNTILSDLKYYLANVIAANTNEALDNLFDDEYIVFGAGTGAGMDGIVYSSAGDDPNLTQSFVTTLNAGGAGATAYVEFYGYITGALTLSGNLLLGFNVTTGPLFTSLFASRAISTSVAADRKYHVYWKITLS